MPDVYSLMFDERNEEKFAARGITARQLTELLETDFVIVKNRRTGAASYLLIGYDAGGMCIAAPIVPGDDYGTWRPITAWPCKTGEQTVLSNQVG